MIESTFNIANHDGLLEMFRGDRTVRNLEAYGKYQVTARFMELLMPTVDQLKNGENLIISVKKL